MVGLGRVVMHRRERLLMLQPRGRGIAATALRYKPEVRNEDNYFDEIPATKVPADMLQLAEHILNQKKGHFDPGEFEDRYEDALTALIKAKRAGKEAPKVEAPKPSNVINLMDALRRSVKGEAGARGHARAKSSGRRTSAKRKTSKHRRLKKAS
jgi:DNA end-binding protein Ku